MATDFEPVNVNGGNQTQTTLNQNFANIKTALSRLLNVWGDSTTGTNSLQADLDMNTNDILNGGNATFADITVGGNSVAASAAAAAASAALALTSETNAATSASNASTSETNASGSSTLASQWAVQLTTVVSGVDYSSKEYAIGTSVPAGSSKDWATQTAATVNGSEYSAKEYAIGTTVAAGSSKDWSVTAEDVLVNGSQYSAFHWAQKAQLSSGGSTVKVSANDTTASYLLSKLVTGANVALTEVNDGANETLQVSVPGNLSAVKVSSNDTTPSELVNKVVSGANVTVTELNNGSNETLEVKLNATVTTANVHATTLLQENSIPVAVGGQRIYSGYADLSGTAITSFRMPGGWSVSRLAIGQFQITHNLGLTQPRDLVAIATGVFNPSTGYAEVWVAATNSFRINMRNVSDSLTDLSFQFTAVLER